MPYGFSYADDYDQYGGLLPSIASRHQNIQQPSLNPFESQYLDLMKKAVPNPLLNAGLSFGTSLLGGVAGLLQGPSEEEKYLQERRRRGTEAFSLIKNRLAQTGNEPEQYLAQFMRATQEQRSREAEGINSRLGLDSGVAQGEMLKNTWNSFLNYSLGAQERNAGRKDNLLAMLAGLA